MKRLFLAFILIQCSLSGYSSYEGIDSASFYLSKAKELSVARKVWEADKNFQKALQFNADDAIRLEYVDYLVGQRKYFPAIDQLGKILEKDNNHRQALERMTDLSFQMQRWSDVVMYGNKLLKSGNFENSGFMLGKSFYELENYGLSQKFLKLAIASNPSDTKSVSLLGKVLVELGNYKEAIVVYHQTLKLSPADNQLTYELGLLYYAMNNEREAVAYFELAAEKGYKKDVAYLENMGMAYLGFDIKKGVETLIKVLELKPGNASILFQVAQAYYKVEKFSEAADAYQGIFDNDNSNVRALYMAGLSLQKKGDKGKGVAICDQAIRMDPSLAQLKTAKSMF